MPFFCCECGKRIQSLDVTVVDVHISLPPNLVERYNTVSKVTTLFLCYECTHRYIEKMEK